MIYACVSANLLTEDLVSKWQLKEHTQLLQEVQVYIAGLEHAEKEDELTKLDSTGSSHEEEKSEQRDRVTLARERNHETRGVKTQLDTFASHFDEHSSSLHSMLATSRHARALAKKGDMEEDVSRPEVDMFWYSSFRAV